MVAPIRGAGGEILTLHRTFLARDAKGEWVKASIEKAKLVIGSYGPGFIWLGEAAG